MSPAVIPVPSEKLHSYELDIGTVEIWRTVSGHLVRFGPKNDKVICVSSNRHSVEIQSDWNRQSKEINQTMVATDKHLFFIDTLKEKSNIFLVPKKNKQKRKQKRRPQ